MVKAAKSNDDAYFEKNGKSPDREKSDVLYGGITRQQIDKYTRSIEASKAKMDKVRGDISNDYKDFEAAGGQKKAFKMAMAVKAMAEDEARDFLQAFFSYLEGLGVNKQLDLFYDQVIPEKVTMEEANPKPAVTAVEAVIAHQAAQPQAATH